MQPCTTAVCSVTLCALTPILAGQHQSVIRVGVNVRAGRQSLWRHRRQTVTLTLIVSLT